ncbi:MAG: hypothetical protein ABSG48_06945 [Geobacteraceae bacterium]
MTLILNGSNQHGKANRIRRKTLGADGRIGCADRPAQDQGNKRRAETRLAYSNEIAALQLKRDEAAVKLQGISTAGDDEWEDLKTVTEQIWGDFTTMLGKAIKKIK